MDRSIGGAETSAHLQTAPHHNLAIAMGSLLVLMPASGVVAAPIAPAAVSGGKKNIKKSMGSGAGTETLTRRWIGHSNVLNGRQPYATLASHST